MKAIWNKEEFGTLIESLTNVQNELLERKRSLYNTIQEKKRLSSNQEQEWLLAIKALPWYKRVFKIPAGQMICEDVWPNLDQCKLMGIREDIRNMDILLNKVKACNRQADKCILSDSEIKLLSIKIEQ